MSFLKKENYRLKSRDTGENVQLFIVEQFGFSHYPDEEILKYIDVLVESGANGLRTFGFFPFGLGREEEPYPRSGSDFDLGRFNDTFYRYLRKWVGYAQEKGIVVLYELFDSVGIKYTQLEAHHPFARFFKHAGTNHTRRLNAFSTLGGQLEQHQKAYLTHTVNILKQYPNVIFGIMNEFQGHANWHHEMSKHVRNLAPKHLISGSEESAPALNDPNVDIWTIHTGSYNFEARKSNLRQDLAGFVPKIGNKIPAFSTDGFGGKGLACENPADMRNLARDIKKNSVQIFRFLDQKAFISRDDAGNEHPAGSWGKNSQIFETAQVKRANTATYRAIAEVLQPTTFQEPEPIELPPGFLCTFKALQVASDHPGVRDDRGGKAIEATYTQGFLAKTSPIGYYDEKPFPESPLDAYFSVYIDNNSFDDAIVIILDVYDTEAKRVLNNWAVTRKQFQKAKEFNLLKLSFLPSPDSKLQFRVYYFGSAYVVLDKIALVQANELQEPLTKASDIPYAHTPILPGTEEPETEEPGTEEPGTEEPGTEEPGAGEPEQEEHDGILGIFRVAKLPSAHPGVFAAQNGKAIKATIREGFLSYGPYIEGYPSKRLEAYFSLLVDNNTADDRHILTIDVHDALQQRVLAHKKITRRDFSEAQKFTLFKLSFTPPAQSRLEFRIFYAGYSYVAADKIAVVEPEKIQFGATSEIPDSVDTSMPETPVVPPPDPSDDCSGDEILCVPQLSDATVQQLGGRNYGGEFAENIYTPANKGGIQFNKTLDVSRKIKIEIELKGNIANAHKTGEHDGGKVTLFAIKERNGSYYMSLQRMHKDYRGGGVFRFILTNNYGSTEGAAFLITTQGLAGAYSTLNWGNEPHNIQVILEGQQCRMQIDGHYKSGVVKCSGNLGGEKSCDIMLGNRLVRYPHQHAITQFTGFKIEYI